MSSNWEVGYKKPPKATRYKPGVSGNPSGRPKGARGRRWALSDILDAVRTITIDGQVAKLTKREIIGLRLVNDAMKGSLSAIKLIHHYEYREREWREKHGDEDHVPFVIRLVGSDADL